jgi:hypothetical protein
MPRFNRQRWTPVKDSSPGYRTDDPRRVILVRKYEGDRAGCPCGCGEMPKGTKAVFAMGHDARLRGKLIRAHLTDTGITYVITGDVPEAGQRFDTTAAQLAAEYGWASYLEAAELRREGKNREVLQRALGSNRLVQVGRWEYTGQVVAVYGTGDEGELEIEYVTKSGDVRRKRVPADEAPEAS